SSGPSRGSRPSFFLFVHPFIMFSAACRTGIAPRILLKGQPPGIHPSNRLFDGGGWFLQRAGPAPFPERMEEELCCDLGELALLSASGSISTSVFGFYHYSSSSRAGHSGRRWSGCGSPCSRP